MTIETVGSYEAYCNDYALYGNPERDASDYEFNAQYDHRDGWCDVDCNDDPGCPVCGYREDCAECVKAKAELDARALARYNERVDCVDSNDVPF